jgi:heterodisulfide reductase subunit A-like polyferredoxin
MAATVDKNKCVGCGECVSACPLDAIAVKDEKAEIDAGTCAECGACIDACPSSAISL